MPTQLQMINRILSELGRLSVSSVNESDDAKYVSDKLYELYPEVLLDCNWNFAVKYREDNTPLTTKYSPQFNYTYLLPSDFGKIFKFLDPRWLSYEFVDNYLITDYRPVRYYYIVNNANFSTFPPLVARSIVLYVASKSAPTLTNDVELSKYLNALYEREKSNAILQNNMEAMLNGTPYNGYDRISLI